MKQQEVIQKMRESIDGEYMTVKTMREYLSVYDEDDPFYTAVVAKRKKGSRRGRFYNVVDVGLLDPGEMDKPVLFLVVDGAEEAKEEEEESNHVTE